jgi:hypothetical protein
LFVPRAEARHHEVSLGHLVLDRVLQVGKGAAEQYDRLLDALGPRYASGLGSAADMVDIVGRVEFVGQLELALAPQLQQHPPADLPVRRQRRLVAQLGFLACVL